MPITMPIPPAHAEFLASHTLGVLATLKRDGRPQLSTVSFRYEGGGGENAGGVIRVSVTDDRAKVKNLRRDPRASMHVSSADGWHWVVAEGTAELSPVALSPDDATVDALVDLYRSIAGEHPDWQEFREAMVAEKRLLLRLLVTRTYGSG